MEYTHPQYNRILYLVDLTHRTLRRVNTKKIILTHFIISVI
jgi:hypothetical protein